jgi:MFS family permease
MTEKRAAGRREPSRRSQRGLDWLNFFVADLQTGFGGFTSVYLAAQGWSLSEIGLALTASRLAGVIAPLPGGALVDAVPAKRLLVGAAVVLIGAGALVISLWPQFWPVVMAQVLSGGSAGIIQPALAAMGLGLVGHGALSRRLGRNQGFNAFGTAATAALMGVLGHFFSMSVPFLVDAALCLPAIVALGSIASRDINYAEARAAADRDNPRQAHRLRDALRNRHLHLFILCLALFQFANASLLPLATSRLGYQREHFSELVTAAAMVCPQALAAIIAMRVARHMEDRGRKPLLLAALGAVALRAVLFAFVEIPWLLVPIQLLDGLAAAIVGIVMPLVIADLARGTGRYNFFQGLASSAMGIGAAISTVASGYATERFGFTAGFLAFAAFALVTAGLAYRFLPETKGE